MKKINDNKIFSKTDICIIGLGYVGLPLLLAFQKISKLKVVGIDNEHKKINYLKSGRSYISDVKINKNQLKNLLFSVDINLIKNTKYIIICLPTPLNKKKQPDLSIFKNSLIAMVPFFKKGQTVILESTTYPGTTKELILPLIERSGLLVGKDIFLAFSPERIDPGSKFKMSKIPKIIGADDKKSLLNSKKIYELIFDKVHTINSSAVAEATKLTENIFRSVNIALVNELKIIFDKMNINIWDVISLANTKPFGYMPFYPGPGLGGHCIPIDPYYLTWKAKQYGVNTQFIELSGMINSSMPSYVVKNTLKAAKKYVKKDFLNLNILIIGVAYKKNTNDLRESPAIEIIDQFRKKKINTNFYDPYIREIDSMRKYPHLSGKKRINLNKKNVSIADVVLIITDHSNINYSIISKYSKVIIDTRNRFKTNQTKAILIKS